MADQDLVLAISADDTMFHVGTPSSLLAHLFPHPDPGGELERHRRPQLFDATGRALEVQRDASGRAVALLPTGVGDVDPDVLVARVDAVLTRAREKLRVEPEAVRPDQVPGAKGPLPAVLAMLEAYGSGPAPGPRGGPRGGVLDQVTRWVVAGADRLTARVPLIAGLRGRFGDGTTVPTGDLEPTDPIPHTGSWFHNLMHRLSG